MKPFEVLTLHRENQLNGWVDRASEESRRKIQFPSPVKFSRVRKYLSSSSSATDTFGICKVHRACETQKIITEELSIFRLAQQTDATAEEGRSIPVKIDIIFEWWQSYVHSRRTIHLRNMSTWKLLHIGTNIRRSSSSVCEHDKVVEKKAAKLDLQNREGTILRTTYMS